MTPKSVALLPLLLTAVSLGQSLPSAAPAPTTAPALRFGFPPPELAVTTLAGKPLTLADLDGQPAVLQFGSLTDPLFRLRQAEVEKLAASRADKARFILVYQKEAHPADAGEQLEVNVTDSYALAAPTSQNERLKLAQMAVDRLKLRHQQVVVDEWNNTTSRRYGGLTNMTFLLDAKGNLAAAYPWMDPKKLAGALDDVLAGKPVAEAHRGPTRSTPPELKGPDPARAYGGVAVLLDAMSLDEKQKAAILPPLAQYVADLRTLREHLASPRDDKFAARQTELTDKTKASAGTLKAALHEHLSNDDYEKVIEALSQGPARRFFTDAK